MIRWFYTVEDKTEITLKKNIGDIGEIYASYHKLKMKLSLYNIAVSIYSSTQFTLINLARSWSEKFTVHC